MQEFTNTSKEENCRCMYDNECEIQILNNGYCKLNCDGHYDKYKVLPDLIKKHYLKENNISQTEYDKCMSLYKNIENNIIPRMMILVNSINTCKQYGYGDWFPDLYNRLDKIYCIGTLSDTILGICYQIGQYDLEITDTIKLKYNTMYKSKNKHITEFKDLLETFEEEYNKFEKEIYDIIYTHLRE